MVERIRMMRIKESDSWALKWRLRREGTGYLLGRCVPFLSIRVWTLALDPVWSWLASSRHCTPDLVPVEANGGLTCRLKDQIDRRSKKVYWEHCSPAVAGSGWWLAPELWGEHSVWSWLQTCDCGMYTSTIELVNQAGKIFSVLDICGSARSVSVLWVDLYSHNVTTHCCI